MFGKATALVLVMMLSGVSLATLAAPALAQSDGPRTVEPTLAECRAFVNQNGVPDERPVAKNRGYSGYDICLNMAYDGDLAGAFASADSSGDGVLQSSEQRAYLDTVLGPASDPDQSPLTLEKCGRLIDRYGSSDEPLAPNRDYGDVQVCQSLALGGDLAGAFAAADANGDGRMDRTETRAYVASVLSVPDSRDAGPSPESTSAESTTPATNPTSAARQQYGTTGGSTAIEGTEGTVEPTTPPAETTSAALGTAMTTTPERTVPATTTTGPDVTDPGLFSRVGSFIGDLPSTGGLALLGLAAAAVLIVGGGFLAYRSRR